MCAHIVAVHEFAYSHGRIDCISAASVVISACGINGTSILYTKGYNKLWCYLNGRLT